MTLTEKTAVLFRHGGSQAVRLPKEFRLPGTAVRVRRVGTSVVLEPLTPRSWASGFWERLASLAPLPDDMRVPSPLPATPHRDAIIDAFDTPAPVSRPRRRRKAPRKRARR